MHQKPVSLPSEALESEEFFASVSDAVPALLWATDANGNCVWRNEEWRRFTGRQNEDPAEASWASDLHPEDATRALALYRRHHEERTSFEMEYRLRHHSGLYRWALAKAAPRFLPGGAFAGFTGLCVDIHEKRHARAATLPHFAEGEALLPQSEERWKILAEAMPQLVWIDRGSDGACEYLSRQWEIYTGRPVQDLLDYGWLDLLHPEDRARTEAAWREAVAGRAEYDIEYRLRRHDGQYRWFKARGVPTRDARGVIQTWCGTCTEIQELVDARHKAEETTMAKSEFLAHMSHEIRTPMNAVIGIANLLSASAPLTPRQREFIHTLQLSADSLLSLINTMLDIAKIESRSVELEAIPFDMSRLMEEIVSIMSVGAKERNLVFSCDAYSIKGKTYLGDPGRIRQIILNLSSNALKFTEAGRVHLSLECAPDPASDRADIVTIHVQDTGIGIAPEKLGTIFQQFKQADSSISRKYGGTGLGLAITKMLAEIMGGSIDAQSEPGQGSVFSVRLKLPLHDGAASASRVSGATTRPDAAADMTAREAGRSCVLLVEDYPANVMVATTFLDQFGYDCDVASNGVEAIEKATTNRYVVALMDVQMHGMNGFEATRLIREAEKQEGRSPLPIIGMTAHALSGDRERCLGAGMDDYLAKPFNPEELQEKIAAFEKS